MPRPPLPIEHGTVRGAQAHRRREEPVCKDCREAWNTYYRKRREAGAE